MPAHEAASFAVDRLVIEWIVTVITSGRGIDKTSEFRLLVVPVVKE